MRKLIVQEFVTLDGFFAGPNGEIDWHIVDEEYDEYANRFLHSVDMLLFGKVTYQMMASYWPTAHHGIADFMNSISKVVVSTSLENAEWQNTRLVKENVVEEITRLKQQSAKDMAIFGSASLASTLLYADLIDEYQLTVAPVVLGEGKPLFRDVQDRINMKLLRTRTLQSGCIQLHYQPGAAH
ncbi:dihydrofolate reductase family protein [Paenibacillus sp. HJGM_3]|uniref:dihydrofolate reductase family protein n=1 Tax=Paenibacillus sp. HJGM_3 TaxID=3379816 RepID=UPI00385BCFD8